MARLNVPPTKSSLLRVRDDLRMATEGFSLLDQKREILVMELMRLLERVRVVQREVEQAREKAHATARKAFTRNGFHVMRRIASGIRYPHKTTIRHRVVAGVRLPEITAEHGEFSLQFGLAETDSLVDETMRDYLALVETLGRMAQLENAAWLLARELKKTQRRVNALEQIFIPDFSDTLAYIAETLESKELEAFAILKIVKARRE
ncbi:MAG: V-type sodium ATPase subunit D [Lentisphaerae bacterium ADurb.BinA184]|nr:MAG: V-type sodium ATPase subunit D [Lentisphaerae bacterium ADurb.BinA184]